MTCQGCGKTLPPSRGPVPRKWCSDKCRKDSSYKRFCVDCGKRLSSSDGNGPNAPMRCVSCFGKTRVVWTRTEIAAAIRRWVREHGEPPTAPDWQSPDRGEGYPPTHTVQRVFGSWNAGIEAAGFGTLAVGKSRRQRVAA